MKLDKYILYFLVILSCLIILISSSSVAVASMIYWQDGLAGAIRRAELNGSNEEVLVTGLVNPYDGIAIDPIGGKMYWVDDSIKIHQFLLLICEVD